jgi:hypothetical protein
MYLSIVQADTDYKFSTILIMMRIFSHCGENIVSS